MKKCKTNQRDQKRMVKKTNRAQGSVTIGMDLGDKTSRYCVLNSEGEILREGQVATLKAGILEKFGSLGPARIAIEVAPIRRGRAVCCGVWDRRSSWPIQGR